MNAVAFEGKASKFTRVSNPGKNDKKSGTSLGVIGITSCPLRLK